MDKWYEDLKAETKRLENLIPLSKATPPSEEEEEKNINDETEDVEEEEEEVEWTEGEEEIFKDISIWLEKVSNTGLNPFANEASRTDRAPIRSKSARVEDPLCHFSWDNREEFGEFVWDGRWDRKGRFTGFGNIYFSNGDEISGHFLGGMREKECTVMTSDVELRGEFRKNRMEGFGRIRRTKSRTTVEGYFHQGAVHGLARVLEAAKPGEEDEEEEFVSVVGRYRNGRSYGASWKIVPGGGCLFVRDGRNKGKFSGQDVAYIYPDLSTCWVGWFDDSRMLDARATKISGCRMEKGIMAIVWELPQETSVRFLETDNSGLFKCSCPRERDPYEDRMVECRSSLIPGAGEGVFLKRSVSPGTVIAFYNGTRIPASHSDDTSESWEDCSYRIFVGESHERMDMPKEFSGIDKYCATLAHKVNHSFTPNCHFSVYEHPRFGRIPCVAASQNLSAGTEVSVCYSYSLTECPKWYSDLWDALGRPRRESREDDDDDV